MIKVKNINGKPEAVPEKYYTCHSDDEYFYYFESKDEADTFYNSLPKAEPTEEPKINPAIEILKNSTDEELIEIANLLKPYLK